MEVYIKYIFILLLFFGGVSFFIFIYYSFFCCKHKINIQSSLPSIFDMVFKFIQIVFIICIVFYSDVIMNYSKAIRSNKKLESYRILYASSISKLTETQINLYHTKLIIYIKQIVRDKIITEIDKAKKLNSTCIQLPPDYKILRNAISYFYENGELTMLPLHIAKLISISLLAKLSKEDMSITIIEKPICDVFNKIISSNKIIFYSIEDLNDFLYVLEDIVEKKIDHIDDILINLENEIGTIIKDDTIDISEEEIKKELEIGS